MTDDIVLEARNLTKRYGDTAAVNGINLSVRKGETFGLLGPNGAGKTTTILMLLGLSEVTEGTARVLGLDPVRAPLAVKRRVGYLPDSVGFYDNLTADENLRYTARLMQIPAAERGPRIGAALDRVGLADVTHKRVGAFSRGMRQRLGIAELLMKRADIAILDEPTSGLDPQATTELLAIIRGLKSDGVTVMLSSHLLDQVQSICDRVALFNVGQIALVGTVPELARQVLGGGYVVEIEAEGAGLVSELNKLPGVFEVKDVAPGRLRLSTDRDIRPEAAAVVVRAGGRLTRLALEEASLETIYKRYFESAQQPREEARHAA
jgi:ABC-2 type transport system ATP-binding protein